MNAYKLPNGNLLVPVRAESKGIVGDSMREVEPGSELFEQWKKWAVDGPEPRKAAELLEYDESRSFGFNPGQKRDKGGKWAHMGGLGTAGARGDAVGRLRPGADHRVLRDGTKVPLKTKPSAAKAKKPATPAKPKQETKESALAGPKSKYRKVDHDKMSKMLGSDYGGHITVRERAAVSEYRGAAYAPMNSVLRGQKELYGDPIGQALKEYGYTKKTLNEEMRHLDSAISKSKVPENIVVHRGMRLPENPESLLGAHITDKAYVSTSLEKGVAQGFRPGQPPPSAVVSIKVPKGATGIYVDAAMQHLWERELLLPRNTKIKITKVSKTRILLSGGDYLWDLEGELVTE
jgi:hypothetical protein